MPSNRKRIKRSIYDEDGLPGFAHLPPGNREEQKQEEPASLVANKSGIQPNIIGNREALLGNNVTFQTSIGMTDPNQSTQLNFGLSGVDQEKPDENMYTSVTAKRTAEQEYRMSKR